MKSTAYIFSTLFLLVLLLCNIAQRAGEDAPEAPEAEVAEPGQVVTMAAAVTPRPTVVQTPTPEPTPAPTPEPTPAPTQEPMPELPEETVEPEVDPVRLEMLACEIYSEAGGDECSDLTRYRCGDVPLMRELDPRFPDTLEEVLTAESQFGRWHWTGIVWPERASREDEAAAVQRAYDTAKDILLGNHSDLWDQGYVWMAEFPQGSDIIYADGIYFGR